MSSHKNSSQNEFDIPKPSELPESSNSNTEQSEILDRIGQITRLLHNSLRELGFDRALEAFCNEVPETQDRLAYVSRLTDESADIVLTAIERGIPLQDGLLLQAQQAEQATHLFLCKKNLDPEIARFAEDTLTFSRTTQATSLETKALLLRVMMAQDFQDMTGQMVQKMMKMTEQLESQLTQVLVDFSTANAELQIPDTVQALKDLTREKRVRSESEIIRTQSQVDALLASLGY
jgi:chemotaxis protein CheZ